jgi:phosphatidylglycerophosphate synthase
MVAVSLIGKFKTAVQMVAILLLIFGEPLWGIPLYTVGFVLLYVAAVLTLWSMALYMKAAWPSLLGKRQVNGNLESKNLPTVEIDGSTRQVND